MDLIRSWLYGRQTPERFSSNLLNPIEVSTAATSKACAGNSVRAIQQDTENNNLNVNITDQETSKLERLILKVVPLEPGDCLGCKLVGTSVMIASGVIVLTSAIAGRKRNPSMTGRKLTTYFFVCGSLFTSFEAAAICRFFDLGPFGYLARLETKGRR